MKISIETFKKYGNPDYDPCDPLANGFCEKCRNCIEDKEKRCKETVDEKGRYVPCRKIGACVTYVPKEFPNKPGKELKLFVV